MKTLSTQTLEQHQHLNRCLWVKVADKRFCGDVLTMRTANDDPICEEEKIVLELHQISSVPRNDREPKPTCFSMDTKNSTIIAAATRLDRHNAGGMVW